MAQQKQYSLEEEQPPCGACGGRFAYAPDQGCLVCQFCGQQKAIPAPERGAPSFLYEQHKATPDETWKRAVALLPLRLTEQEALAAARKWLKREGALGGTTQLRVEAVYLPYYLFSMKATADYRGSRGERYTETETLRGLRDAHGYHQERRITKTRWSPASGLVSQPREEIAIAAVKSLPNDFVGRLDWDIAELRPFDEAYLAGWRAQSPQLDLNKAHQEAIGVATSTLKYAALAEVGGDEQKISRLTPKFSQESFRLVMLPVYSGSFLAGGLARPLAINGYSGEVAGDAPDTLKKKAIRWLAYAGVAAVMVPAYVIFMLFIDYDFEEIIGLPLMLGSMVGVFLLFLRLQEKLHILLLTLLYALTLGGIGYALWFITESSGIVVLTEVVLIVLGLILLPASYGGKKDAARATADKYRRDGRLPP